MTRDSVIVIDEMLSMIDFIEISMSDKTRSDFQQDMMLRLAVERAIEIVSEASRHLPTDLLAREREIPWNSIRGMGNVLRHEYHRVASEVILDVITGDLPPLKAALLRLNKDGQTAD
ncbi:HepT-like ribonuclease domain-containing protein [Rhizobium sp. SAFR-030]|uniref:HepT-like ribonuclease domain-containing protein n=1 Tax=Rhizobium sp. SAFR-030 TaxID=3387277 RepID=UPI003F8054B9